MAATSLHCPTHSGEYSLFKLHNTVHQDTSPPHNHYDKEQEKHKGRFPEDQEENAQNGLVIVEEEEEDLMEQEAVQPRHPWPESPWLQSPSPPSPSSSSSFSSSPAHSCGGGGGEEEKAEIVRNALFLLALKHPSLKNSHHLSRPELTLLGHQQRKRHHHRHSQPLPSVVTVTHCHPPREDVITHQRHPAEEEEEEMMRGTTNHFQLAWGRGEELPAPSSVDAPLPPRVVATSKANNNNNNNNNNNKKKKKKKKKSGHHPNSSSPCSPEPAPPPTSSIFSSSSPSSRLASEEHSISRAGKSKRPKASRHLDTSSASSSSSHEEGDSEEGDGGTQEDNDDDDDEGILFTPQSTSSTGLHARKRKRPVERKRATADQVVVLEKMYEKDRFPSSDLIKQTGEQLGMKPSKVKNWFQNKRAKERRIAAGKEHPSSGTPLSALKPERGGLKQQETTSSNASSSRSSKPIATDKTMPQGHQTAAGGASSGEERSSARVGGGGHSPPPPSGLPLYLLSERRMQQACTPAKGHPRIGDLSESSPGPARPHFLLPSLRLPASPLHFLSPLSAPARNHPQRQ